MPVAVFSTAAVTVGGPYQVTGSVAVTITGTATGVLLAGWGANQDKLGPGGENVGYGIHRQLYDLSGNPLRKPETVHGITSLTAWQANPADLLAGNRGHWEVEKREHYVRDRTFDEDRSQVRTGSSPQFLATARDMVISLLRLAECLNIPRAWSTSAGGWTRSWHSWASYRQRSRREAMPNIPTCK